MKGLSTLFRWLLTPREYHAEPRFSATRYARQRRAGFPLLRFIPGIEAEYRESFVPVNISRLRFANLFALPGMLGFILFDSWVGQGLQPLSADLLLLLVATPALLLPVAMTYTGWGRSRILAVTQAGTVVSGLAVVAVVIISKQVEAFFPYEAVLLVMFYAYFVSGLLWRQAVLCAWVMGLAYIAAAAYWLPQPPALLVYDVYYVMLGNLIGMIGKYFFEYQDRSAFLANRELRYLAQHDPLTGLLNRRAFRDRAGAAWAQAQRDGRDVAIALVDLDDFKKLNDRYGHLTGDAALRGVASILRDITKRPFDAAGRYGGDEMVAIWYDVDPAWLKGTLDAGLARINQLSLDGAPSLLKLKSSIGAVVAWPRAGVSLADAIKAADESLYVAKEAGGNRAVLGDTLGDPISRSSIKAQRSLPL